MDCSELTESERKVWEAAATGTLVDLRTGDPKLDSPEKGAEWGTERTIRSEVIAALLIGVGEAASITIRGVRLQGARITGELNLEAATLRCPLALLDCSFASPINLGEATALSVRLSGSHVPAIRAQQLRTRGDLQFNKGFSVTHGVHLVGAHIDGDLDCSGAQFSNPDGLALNADGLIVDGGMFCRKGFSARGELRLLDAHIGGTLDCTGGRFSNPNAVALSADGLTIEGNMFCRKEFSARGELRLLDAHIGGTLDCTGGRFSNPNGYALSADGAIVESSMFCQKGFSARGVVRLLGVRITGQLNCTGGRFSNPNGIALYADALTVGRGMFCEEGFAAEGQVRLRGAHIRGTLTCTGGRFSNPDAVALSADGLTVEGSIFCLEGFAAEGQVGLVGAHIDGTLNCRGGRFSNPDAVALNLKRVTVSGPLFMESVVLDGTLDLTAAQTSSYHDNPASWPERLLLDRFTYETIEGASAKERLDWLRRNESGYSPQIYEQLAAVYRRSGNDEDARRILIAKQRRRSAEGTLTDKVWGLLLDALVGYGYRTGRAVLWLVGLLILGTYLFGSVYRGDLTPVNKPDVQPPFQPFLYTLDLLLPVVSLHIRDAWVAHGAAQVWNAVFIIMGWILATAVVLSLTGLLKRD